MPPLSLFLLARTLLLRGPLRAAALGLSLAATVALAWALPMTESAALDGGLREALTDGAQLTVEHPSVGDFAGFVSFERQAASSVDSRLGPYVTAGSVLAITGPLAVTSVADQPLPGGSRQLTAAYLDDLASHVEVVAGSLPPDGLGGPDPAVTMPQRGADQLGLRLSERFCVDLAPGAWCARLVGLWNPLRTSDPYWAGQAPRLVVALGRYDFFKLLPLRSQGAVAGRRYAIDLSAVTPASAADLAGRVHDLAGSLKGSAALRLTATVDVALARYDASQAKAALVLNVLMAVLMVLALCLVQLAASRVVDLQARDVTLLRVRGWQPLAAWRFLFVQLCVIGLLALPLGLVAAALVTAALAATSGAAPSAGDLVTASVSLLAVLGGAAGMLAVAAWSVAARQPGAQTWSLGPAVAWWRRWNVDLPLAGIALALVLVRPGRLLDSGPLGFVTPVLTVSIVGLVALRALPLMGRTAGGSRAGLASALAGWQLRRRPDQHAGLVLMVVLTLVTAGFCALELAVQPLVVRDLDAIHHGFEAVATAVLVAASIIGLAGVSLHFQAAARARGQEYASLALDGLPAAAARRSLGIEQLVTLGYALGVGTLLAVALFAGVAGGGVGSGLGDEVSAALEWAALPTGLAVVCWLVRRTSFRGLLLEELRRW